MDAHEKPDEPCLLDCIFLRRFATSDGSSKEFFIEKLSFKAISFVLKNLFPKRIQFFCSWNSLSSISSRVIAAQTLSMIIQKFSFFQVFFCWGSASFVGRVQVGFCRVPDAVQKLFPYFPDPVPPRFHEPFESVLLCPQPRIKSMLSFPQSCEKIFRSYSPVFPTAYTWTSPISSPVYNEYPTRLRLFPQKARKAHAPSFPYNAIVPCLSRMRIFPLAFCMVIFPDRSCSTCISSMLPDTRKSSFSKVKMMASTCSYWKW